jgi:hypothetical protein
MSEKRTLTGPQILDARAGLEWILNHNEANPGAVKPVNLVRLIRTRRALGGPLADIDALRKSLAEQYANGDGRIAEDKQQEANGAFVDGLAAIHEEIDGLPVDIFGDFLEAPTSVVAALEPILE